MYNDEGPDTKADGYRAHAKGVVHFDSNTGFWLVHSVPKFPPAEAYDYPDTGTKFAQSMLCTSHKISELPKIAEQLYYSQPSVYYYNLPAAMATAYPRLSDICADKTVSKAPYMISNDINTAGGQLLKCFHKHRNYGKDVYADYVSPALNFDMFVETWLNGVSKDLPAKCGVPNEGSVYNLRGVNPNNITFASSMDHSKCAFSVNPNKPYVCIGDINRQESQWSRGGGTCCLAHRNLHAVYRSAVNVVECCSGDQMTTTNPCAVAPK